MIPYAAPLADMRFAIETVGGLDTLTRLPAYAEATPDLVNAVLEEGARLARDVLAPLNQTGDREGSRLDNGIVRTPAGFADAYQTFRQGGWCGVPFGPDFGGQGLPWLVNTALNEMWCAANLSFSLCPLLSQGAVEALEQHGSDWQKEMFLGRLISGEWTGTMNLTEPQAGSDVGALRTRARRDGDHYRIRGQKIYITWGDHDVADNIIHLVLARVDGAPEGIRGISLFLVPKVLVNEDGTLGAHNDLRAVSLEEKLGIHASPTCVMSYGDDEGAVGYLIGEENRGIEYMFTMMNNARLGVGLQGLGVAERALQKAREYAAERVQGRDATGREKDAVAIIAHPDVRRMLMTMKAHTESVRALGYYAASWLDRSRVTEDPAGRKAAQGLVDLLIPVVKAHITDTGVEVASLGVQVHGGMGFIEETGAAQYYRDARIAPIYEGTNGIQAIDLVSRKVVRDGGQAAGALVGMVRDTVARVAGQPGDDMAVIARAVELAADSLERSTNHLIGAAGEDVADALAGATPYLRLFGHAVCAWLLAEEALVANERLMTGEGDPDFLEAKLVTARFYAEQILPPALALETAINSGSRTIMSLSATQI